MKCGLAVFCLIASVTSAAAQYGVSNARDGNGNLVRSNGMGATRNYDQAPVNNITNAPKPAPTPPPKTITPKTSGN